MEPRRAFLWKTSQGPLMIQAATMASSRPMRHKACLLFTQNCLSFDLSVSPRSQKPLLLNRWLTLRCMALKVTLRLQSKAFRPHQRPVLHLHKSTAVTRADFPVVYDERHSTSVMGLVLSNHNSKCICPPGGQYNGSNNNLRVVIAHGNLKCTGQNKSKSPHPSSSQSQH